MLIAVTASLAAAACFAVAGVLQQRAATGEPEHEAMSYRLLTHLARRPLWLAGIGCAIVAYAFQSVALAHGPLSLVQPLLVTELLFAIPLSVRLYGTRLHLREWLGAAAVAVGLATAMAAAAPQRSKPVAGVEEWTLAMTAAAAATVGVLFVSRRVGGPSRASVIAAAAGIVMGSQSVLLATTVATFRTGAVELFTAWQTYLLVLASILGLLLIQSSFQAGPLSASMPVIDTVEPLVAVACGVVLFDESVRSDPIAVGFALLGGGLVLTGIWLLDTSPMLRALHERTHRPAGEADWDA
ncbi:DMT family transporter [Streptomyces sp. TR06-5]|uniref:DMT family transporter n=1 Tax=unclassified Streptomyces TaxID=2593676 RepID=UPI0039A06631